MYAVVTRDASFSNLDAWGCLLVSDTVRDAAGHTEEEQHWEKKNSKERTHTHP
jgi:hypothetical protein